MFVVTLPAHAADQAEAFSARARAAGADLLEIRGDLTPHIAPFDAGMPLLLAPRGREMKPFRDIPPAWVDLEAGEDWPISSGTRVVRSIHHYDGTPDLPRLMAELRSLAGKKPAATWLKVATRVRDVSDLLVLRDLQRPRDDDTPLIVLGMGPLSWPNRILSPWRNPLTYAALDEDSRSAPGQLLLRDYRRFSAAREPQLFAILGGRAMNTLSPLIHNALFERHGVAAFYGAWPGDHCARNFKGLADLGVEGFSVTAPHKSEALSLVQETDHGVQELGAINTARRRGDDWKGWAFDARGLLQGYPHLKGKQKVAIVGAGGVVSSVVSACLSWGAEVITIAARNEFQRTQLAERFAVQACALEDLRGLNCDLVIWALPCDLPGLVPEAAPGASFLDLRYGRPPCFLDRMRALGYRVHDGLPMLVHQALAQFEVFSEKKPAAEDATFLQELLKPHVTQ